jgi:pSer/pThr/pTyr-binding forkhead associated (FHA) protein
MALTIRIRGGKHNGQEIRVAQKHKYLIGRAEDCHLRPQGTNVSRYHCVLMVEEPEVVLRDMGSTNGTFVNGVRVSAPTPLRHGDLVTVGKLQFECLITSLKAAAKARPTVDALEEECVDLEEGSGTRKKSTEDTQILNAQEAAILGLDLAGPAPRFRPPTFTPRPKVDSALDAIRNFGGRS